MAHEGELRATSDLMLQMLDRLRAAEEEKRGLAPGTQEFARIAYDVVDLARLTSRWAELQLRQANEALAEQAERGPAAPPPSVLTTVEKRRLDEVLAEWRRAEMRLSQAAPGTRDAGEAAAEAERLRLEYRELQEQKRTGQEAKGFVERG